MGCLIRMQRWQVNMPRSKYCALDHRCEQTCSETVLVASWQLQTRWLLKSGEANARGRRAVSRYIHVGSNDAAFRWLSQLRGIMRGSFQETAPRKTAKNTVRFDGSQLPWWRWKFGGRNNTTIFDNIDLKPMFQQALMMPIFDVRCVHRPNPKIIIRLTKPHEWHDGKRYLILCCQRCGGLSAIYKKKFLWWF